jgi:probable F420-dependent oxidoreductase
MHIGIISNCSDQSLEPGKMAQMVEEAGFESLFFGEHTHIPAATESAYPGGDGSLPPGYERKLDLFVALTVAALATDTLKVGSGICQVVQRDPILTAKQVASLDHVSNGRMVFITGSSWNVHEMRNHGTDPETRYELLEERVLAMREIWAEDEASFHGRFVNFDQIWSWPKPVQNPFPVFIGGNGDDAEERALRIGTGWAPLQRPGTTDRIEAYLQRAAADGIETSVTGVITSDGDISPELIGEYQRAGAERLLIGIRMTDSEAKWADGLQRLQAVQAELAGTP